MGSFTVQNMLGSKALVSGVDDLGNTGSVVLDTTQWDEIQTNARFSTAKADFDAAVNEFFAPLVEAAEAAEAAAQQTYDELEYVVVTEAQEGQPSVEQEILELTRDSIILRIIESGDTSRLIWVSPTELGVLAKS